MPIKLARTIVSSFFRTSGPIMMISPIFLVLAFVIFFPLVDSISTDIINMNMTSPMAEEAKKQVDNTTSVFFIMIIAVSVFPVIHGIVRSDVSRIVQTANTEKRMEKLKKMGAREFIKKTDAVLIHESSRGNKLYSSTKIIPRRELKFLIYNDKSTDREYISFVENHFMDADEAMASKFSLDSFEYDKLRNEA